MRNSVRYSYIPPYMISPSNIRHDLEAGLTLPEGKSTSKIDEDLITRSLEHVNNFAKRRQNDRFPQVLMYEIFSSGESSYESMTLRELLQYVNETALNNNGQADTIFSGVKMNMNSSHKYMKDDLAEPLAQTELPGKAGIAGAMGTSGTVLGSASEEAYDVIGELRLRDLRRLDFQYNPNEERAVLIRRHAVLFAMDPMRAVVMADRLILIVPDGADSLLSILDKYMKEWVTARRTLQDMQHCAVDTSPVLAAMKQSGQDVKETESTEPPSPTRHHIQQLRRAVYAAYDLPFEMHAYEALLTTAVVLESQEFQRVHAQVQVILGYFRSGALLPVEVQEQMRNRKNELSAMTQRIASARNAITELTDEDEEMCLMNLTTLRAKSHLYHYPLVPEILTKHDEVEELLESYLIDFSALESKIGYTRSQIQSAEESLSLRLDTARNELLYANTNLAILACCFGLGAYVSGIFGMNLDNTQSLEHTPNVFYIVIAVSTTAMILLFVGIVCAFRASGMFPARLPLQCRDARKIQ